MLSLNNVILKKKKSHEGLSPSRRGDSDEKGGMSRDSRWRFLSETLSEDINIAVSGRAPFPRRVGLGTVHGVVFYFYISFSFC